METIRLAGRTRSLDVFSAEDALFAAPHWQAALERGLRLPPAADVGLVVVLGGLRPDQAKTHPVQQPDVPRRRARPAIGSPGTGVELLVPARPAELLTP